MAGVSVRSQLQYPSRDLLAYGERCCGRRAWGVQNVERIASLYELEVLEQFALRRHRLGAHPRFALKKIVLIDGRNEPPQGRAEPPLAE